VTVDPTFSIATSNHSRPLAALIATEIDYQGAQLPSGVLNSNRAMPSLQYCGARNE
jgi:hypothetical protein